MTRRLAVVVAAALVATLAAGGFALSLRGGGSAPAASPTWGVFTDAQWRALGARIGGSSMKVVAAMPQENGRPFAVVAARRYGRTCFFVVRGVSPSAPICALERPMLAFTAREHDGIDIVGLVRPDVESVVASYATFTQASALLPTGNVLAFDSRYPSKRVTLTAHVHGGAVAARLYCASALRAVCGMSAQRRS